MMEVALCITQNHDLSLVALALLVCLGGSATTIQLFERIGSAADRSHSGWIVLAATGTGTMVWSTHFVAMMAFRSAAPVVLDPVLTLASLVLAMVLAAPGLTVASRRQRRSGLLGGAIVGLAISSMHYVGMAAYRVDGIVTWDWRYVLASVLLSSTLAALAFQTLQLSVRFRRVAAGALLALAVATLHFTGMAAMKIAVLDLGGGGLSDLTQTVLAITTAVAGFLILGCAAVSALIDRHTQNESYQRLRRMALHDGLTDLPNRMNFNQELNRRLGLAGHNERMAVVMIDLSRFKTVNDSYGHHAGDQLLIALAARLSTMLATGECLARLGGDEFAALVPYRYAAELDTFLQRLSATFEAPFVFEQHTTSVAANIGLALAPQDGRSADELLAKADLAMYRAKSAHSGEPCHYFAAMDDSVRDRRELAGDLRAAVASGAFELHYQVQASIATGGITGYEALVRWLHPKRGLVPPAVFIPLAEEVGEIIPLSIWILRQACSEAAAWPERHKVSVNLSPLHLADPRLLDTVRQALADSGLGHEFLMLELTESAIIHDRHVALAQLRALKAMGVGIALDDFGVGYSSLDVLRSFAFDRIKLDASFVSEIEQDEQAVSILRSVAALGATLGMPVLAEGVENLAQLSIVAREGCQAIQGYLIGRPSKELAKREAVRLAMQLTPRIVAAVQEAA